jgi:hypothetical protein
MEIGNRRLNEVIGPLDSGHPKELVQQQTLATTDSTKHSKSGQKPTLTLDSLPPEILTGILLLAQLALTSPFDRFK